MIIPALVEYYEQLRRERPDEVAGPGWCSQKVRARLVLTPNGELRNIQLLGEDLKGVSQMVPDQVKRSSGVAANFLCDNSSYFLGIDDKGKPERSRKCFEASRDRHHRILDGVDTVCAKAVLNFFDNWDVERASEHPAVNSVDWTVLTAGNLAFTVVGEDGSLRNAENDEAIVQAWDRACMSDGDVDIMTCLVTGERGPIARLHPSIKGVAGAQSSGATLVGFNAPAFESYGHEQGANAPVGVASVQAYGTALNYLLGNAKHRIRLGDTTVVYWASHKDAGNCSLMSALLGGVPASKEDGESLSDDDLAAIMEDIRLGKPGRHDRIDLGAEFYILGLAPNAARLSVRFFYHGQFGSMLANIARHYERLELACPPKMSALVLTPCYLLEEIKNQNAKSPIVSSVLTDGLFKAVLEGGRYPEALYENALLRIRATREVSWGRASIIKAYLLRNAGKSESEVTVALNRSRNETAYALGRAFAILEGIQEKANGKATIADRYLDAACATPATVFPVLLKLSQSHRSKIERSGSEGLARWFERELEETLSEENVLVLPRRLSLIEQGDFFLGYYQQKWRDHKPKTTDAEITESAEIAENQEA